MRVSSKTQQNASAHEQLPFQTALPRKKTMAFLMKLSEAFSDPNLGMAGWILLVQPLGF